MSSVASSLFSCIPLTGAFALVVLIAFRIRLVWKREHRVPAGDLLWILSFTGLLLLVGIFCMRGGVSSEIGLLDLFVFSMLVVLFGAVSLLRNSTFNWLKQQEHFPASCVRSVRDVSILLSTAVVSTWHIDYVWCDVSGDITILFFGVTALLLLSVEVFLYFLGQRTGVLVCLVPIVAFGFGAAQYFVLAFKGTVVLPSDLLVLGTAVEVSSGYTFVLTQRIVYGICSVAACICMLSFVMPGRSLSVKGRYLDAALNVSLACVLGLSFSTLYRNIKIEDVLNAPPNRWMPIDTYKKEGFTLGFMSMMQDLAIPVPEGYSDESAQEILDELASKFDANADASLERAMAASQFEGIQPSVVVVMNESFSDLSLHQALKDAGYEGPKFYNSLSGTLQRGTLMSSVVGGATANTEFEFLVGATTGFMGSYKYPYQLYNFSNVESLPRQFSSLGYRTTAMHPMLGSNYNRASNYKRLGFDQFLDINDFPNAPTYHAGARDSVTYDKIIELLSEDETPQFIFDVTMQNHGGYAGGTVPQEDLVDWAPEDLLGVDLSTQLNTYMTCIEESDRDLEVFIDRLSELERPVVLVFFGDHQPNISGALNDTLYPGEEAFAHVMRTYESSYLVWSNYEIEGTIPGVVKETSASQLAAQVLNGIGAPLSDYQKAQLVLDEDIVSVNFLGYRGSDGLRYAFDVESPYRDALVQMQTIQYFSFARNV